MKSIAIEDIATVFASEFVKSCGSLLHTRRYPERFTPFLKMSYARRRKIVEKVLDRMQKERS